ncbi:MAG: hypothetical protein AB1805_07425 [Nitrospirota bacterium]
MWTDILRREVEAKGPKAVGKEIGYSRATVDLVIKGTYQGDLAKIERIVMKIYGKHGKVLCPVMGEIAPADCATNWKQAKQYGGQSGNPIKLRLFRTCLGCSVRR